MHRIHINIFLIYFFFLTKLSVAQDTTPFSSINPIGEISDNSFANNLAMGGVGISNGSYWHLNNQNPAALVYNRFTTFEMGVASDVRQIVNDKNKDIYLKNGRFGPYLQFEIDPDEIEEKSKRRKKIKKKDESLKNVSIPKGIDIDTIDLEKAKYLCSLPKNLGLNPENQKEIFLNSGRFGPYLKCESKSARLENVEDIFTIGLNRAITLIAEAKPGRISSSLIKDLGEHPEDKKPVRVMKGQYGPYIKYKSLNATIPEEKDPTELTMEEALILIEKRKEYDKTKKKKKKK